MSILCSTGESFELKLSNICLRLEEKQKSIEIYEFFVLILGIFLTLPPKRKIPGNSEFGYRMKPGKNTVHIKG